MVVRNSPFSNNDEGRYHKLAKVRVARVLDDYITKMLPENWIVDTFYEYKFGKIETSLGIREYTADVLIDARPIKDQTGPKPKQLCLEIDGKVGHSSAWERMKDNVRDQSLITARNCYTVRYITSWVTGYKPRNTLHKNEVTPLTDKEIIDMAYEKAGNYFKFDLV